MDKMIKLGIASIGLSIAGAVAIVVSDKDESEDTPSSMGDNEYLEYIYNKKLIPERVKQYIDWLREDNEYYKDRVMDLEGMLEDYSVPYRELL